MVWNTVSRDPIKATILRAVLPHVGSYYFMGQALCQIEVFISSLPMEERSSLLKCFQTWDWRGFIDAMRELARYPEIWSSPISGTQREGTSSSNYALQGRAIVGPDGA